MTPCSTCSASASSARFGTVSPDEILMALKTNQGYDRHRLALPPPARLQDGLVVWLIDRRAGLVGPDGQSPFGEFAPIPNASGTVGAIVFYPSGDPLPPAHLLDGTPLPSGYQTAVLRILSLGPLGSAPEPQQPAQHRPVGASPSDRRDTASSRPMPTRTWCSSDSRIRRQRPTRSAPPSTSAYRAPSRSSSSKRTLRCRFSSAVRAAAASTSARTGRSFATNSAEATFRRTPATPTPTSSPSATTTLRSPARAPDRRRSWSTHQAASGDRVQVFSLPARKSATGTMALSPAGAPAVLRFGGTTVRAGDFAIH